MSFYPTIALGLAKNIIKYTKAGVIILDFYILIDYYFKYHDILISLDRKVAGTVFKVTQM